MTTQQALAHPWIVKYAPQVQEAPAAVPQKENISSIPEDAPVEDTSADSAQTENVDTTEQAKPAEQTEQTEQTKQTEQTENADGVQPKQKTDPELNVPQQLKK